MVNNHDLADAKPHKSILPGSTLGIFGGGQLGRMMILAGKQMGYKFISLDPNKDCPAAQVADEHLVASYNDVDLADVLGKATQLITYEFENVDANVAEHLEQHYHLPQGSALLRVTQNRNNEKTVLKSYGMPVADFVSLKWDSQDVSASDVKQMELDFTQAVERLGVPCVLKTATGGYDGKGQWLLRSEKDVINASNIFSKSVYQKLDFIVEKFIAFTKELSIIVARNQRGEVVTWPVAENVHVNSILFTTAVPAAISSATEKKAEEIASRLAEKINLKGLLAIELFCLEDGGLLINELAPRPHNSGHYTMDASATSQFEQHIRAVCNLPLGETRLLSPVVMVNILGQHIEPLMKMIERLPAQVKIHLYGKAEAKENRKMGHLNVVANSTEEAHEIIRKLEIGGSCRK